MKTLHAPSSLFKDRQLNFLVVVNILIVIVAMVLSHGAYGGIDNVQSMASQLPEVGLLALGIMLSMISGNGGIDLSGVGAGQSVGHGRGTHGAAHTSAVTIPRSSTPPPSSRSRS